MFFLIKKDVRGYSLATMVISVTVLAFIVTAITMWGISFSKGVEKAKAKLPPNATVLFIEPIKDKFEVLWKRRK